MDAECRPTHPACLEAYPVKIPDVKLYFGQLDARRRNPVTALECDLAHLERDHRIPGHRRIEGPDPIKITPRLRQGRRAKGLARNPSRSNQPSVVMDCGPPGQQRGRDPLNREVPDPVGDQPGFVEFARFRRGNPDRDDCPRPVLDRWRRKRSRRRAMRVNNPVAVLNSRPLRPSFSTQTVIRVKGLDDDLPQIPNRC